MEWMPSLSSPVHEPHCILGYLPSDFLGYLRPKGRMKGQLYLWTQRRFSGNVAPKAYVGNTLLTKSVATALQLNAHSTLALAKMINAVLVFNNAGQPRLTKFYTQLVCVGVSTSRSVCI